MGCIRSPVTTSWDEQRFQSLSPHQFSHYHCQEGGQLKLLLTVILLWGQALGMKALTGIPKSWIWICRNELLKKKKKAVKSWHLRKPLELKKKIFLPFKLFKSNYWVYSKYPCPCWMLWCGNKREAKALEEDNAACFQELRIPVWRPSYWL